MISLKIRIDGDEFEYAGDIRDVPLTQVVAWVNQWLESTQSALQKRVDAMTVQARSANTSLKEVVDSNTPPAV